MTEETKIEHQASDIHWSADTLKDFEKHFPSLEGKYILKTIGSDEPMLSILGDKLYPEDVISILCLDRQRVKKLLLPLKSELISHSANQRGLVITHRLCEELLERIEELGLEE